MNNIWTYSIELLSAANNIHSTIPTLIFLHQSVAVVS